MSWVKDYHEFEKIEKKMDLFRIRIQGILFWERLRFQVYYAIETRFLDKSFSKRSNGPKKKRWFRLLSSVLKFSRNPLFAPHTDILILATSRRVFEDDGLWWDIYTDPFIERLKNSYLSIEPHFEDKHYSPPRTKNLRYLDFAEFMSYLRRILVRAKIELTKQETEILNDVSTEIYRRFSVDIDILEMTRRMLEERKSKLPEYRRILMSINPKVVIFSQGYMYEDWVEVCKSMGIPTVEIQHGVIYPFHSAYSYPSESIKKATFPDYILLWGDYWRKNVTFPINDENVISTGFPYIERKREMLAGTKKKKQILFISQGNIGEELSRFAVELSKEPNFEHTIAYKLHPQEQANWKEKYPWIIDSEVHVVNPTKSTLYQLFAESTIQVGVCSTALFEGLAFGLKTYVFDASCVELMDPLVESKIIKKVSNPKEFLGHLSDDTTPINMKVEEVFKKNATRNIVSLLANLCREKVP